MHWNCMQRVALLLLRTVVNCTCCSTRAELMHCPGLGLSGAGCCLTCDTHYVTAVKTPVVVPCKYLSCKNRPEGVR